MKSRLPVLILGIALVIIGGFFVPRLLNSPNQLAPAPAPVTASGQGQSHAETATPPSPPKSLVERESQRAGMLSPDPTADEKRLNDEARALGKPDLEALSLLARDPNAAGDPRATAAELLARAHSSEAVPPLESLAMEPLPKGLEPRALAFEQALRGRAIEGLGQTPGPAADKALAKLRSRVDDPFLRDRLERAAAARRGAVDSPEKQDEKALRKLLDSP